MSKDRATQIAIDLMKLGVSNRGVEELLANYPYDLIERQLHYLPFRKARRPEAFIMDAVRHSYSPPKEFFYAKTKAHLSTSKERVDESAELPDRFSAP